MFSLTIAESAAELIREEVRRSGIKRPAVQLLQIKDGVPSEEELMRMQVSDASLNKLREMVAKEPGIDRGKRRLVPLVRSRLRFFGLFLVEVSGIVFFFPPSFRKRASGGTLDVSEGTLVLRDREGRIVMPAQPQ